MGSVLSTIQTVQLKCGSIPFSLALVSHLCLPKLCLTPGLAKIVMQVLKALNVPLFSFAWHLVPSVLVQPLHCRMVLVGRNL